ncbi:MAG TPA: hypothetical protein VLB80_02450 [Candidatus Babeliales bacterium]|nr:hypothetical protein [Candidatus Babeliales bacterium]
MKRSVQILSFVFALFPCIIFSEGFVAGILVKTPAGYERIDVYVLSVA